MFESDDLEVWNLTHGTVAITGAQRIFNIVGRLKFPEAVSMLTYRLNGGPEKQVFTNDTEGRSGRLERPGDFSIDTIRLEDLQPSNHLVLRVYRNGHPLSSLPLTGNSDPVKTEYAIDFSTRAPLTAQPDFQLRLDEIDAPEQAGQIVDGKWRLGCDEQGKPCLEIQKQDAGYDRIILFGHHGWSSNYEINAMLCVREWTHNVHNVGLLFKWNSHPPGDGRCLPTVWSTGLGYYYSRSSGLRLRVGVNVQYDGQGNKVGDTILVEGPLSNSRWQKARLFRRFFSKSKAAHLLNPGIPYRFHLRVEPNRYSLAVWQDGKKLRQPQLFTRIPVDSLPHGSVGIIAYHCAVRVYEYEVHPLQVESTQRENVTQEWRN